MLQDKRMEIDKHSLNIGDYNRTVGKGPGSRPQISKESSMERSPYFDKVSCSFVFCLFYPVAKKAIHFIA